MARRYALLLVHRSLWLAVLLDQPGLPNYAKPCRLLTSGLIKLRDLPDNLWNADKLFIMTEDHERARELARVIQEEDDWGGEKPVVYEDQEVIDMALGTGRMGYGLLSIWWD